MLELPDVFFDLSCCVVDVLDLNRQLAIKLTLTFEKPYLLSCLTNDEKFE